MAPFLFLGLPALPYLITYFGIISLIRRRFEKTQLVLNAIITLVIYWVSILVLAMLYFAACSPHC